MVTSKIVRSRSGEGCVFDMTKCKKGKREHTAENLEGEYYWRLSFSSMLISDAQCCINRGTAGVASSNFQSQLEH